MSTLLLLVAQVHAASLPDSGQTVCDDGTHVMAACSLNNTSDAAPLPRQDGRFGRDPKAAAGTLVKIGAGAAGFDYTKVGNNGSDLAAAAALGVNPADWACTRDNVTGLTWEVKTATNTDLRFSGHTYTWYSTDATTNGGSAGVTGANTCNATLPGNLCNTQALVTAVNSAALCGASDWRLPTRRELFTLVHLGVSNPSIDPTYFSNTPASGFWSASSYVPSPTGAWDVGFFDGFTFGNGKGNNSYVRLVRGGQF